MKKQLRLIVSLMLALSLFLALGVAVYAEDEFVVHGAKKIEGLGDPAVVAVELKGEGINAGNCAFIAVKQSASMMIWTQTELTDDQKAQIAAAVEAVDGSNYKIAGFCFGAGSFVMGEVTGDTGSQHAGEYTFSINGNSVTLICDASKISHAVYGTYTIPEPDPPMSGRRSPRAAIPLPAMVRTI